jgi:predicted metalloprotease with PDZ domain
LSDLRSHLATLTGDKKFADDFFDKYVEGRDVADYASLLELAGYSLRRPNASSGWTGLPAVALQETTGGLTIGGPGRGGGRGGPVNFGTPAYNAGLDLGDVIVSIDGAPATLALWNALPRKPPQTPVSLVVKRRDGATVTHSLTLGADPTLQVEDLGNAISPAQKAFRDAWLGTRVK